jgi:hypothetical protein
VVALQVQARVKTTGGKRRGGARGVTSSRGSGWHGVAQCRRTPRSARPRRPCGHVSAVATARRSASTRASVAALLCYTPFVCACTQTAGRCPWPERQMRRACASSSGGGGSEGGRVKGQRWWRRQDGRQTTGRAGQATSEARRGQGPFCRAQLREVVRSSSGKGSGPTSTAALGSLAAFTITTPPPQSGAPPRPGCQIHHVCTLHPGNAIDYIFQSTPWRPNSLLSPRTLSAYKRLFAPVALLPSPSPNPRPLTPVPSVSVLSSTAQCLRCTQNVQTSLRCQCDEACRVRSPCHIPGRNGLPHWLGPALGSFGVLLH